MQRPISLKIYSIALGLLVLMVVVTGLSARNLKILNNEVAALSGYYVPLDQQIGSVETLVRQQVVHFERILLLMQARDRDRAALEEEQRLFDQRGVNADQVIDSSLRLVEQAIASREVDVDRVAFAVLKDELPDIQTARQHFHATFRQFLIEAEEGNPRSLKIVREAMVREKDAIDARMEKVIVVLQKVTQGAADNARAEEEKSIRLNWGITFIAGVLGLIFAAVITRNLVQPVRRLLSGTKKVEEGDLSIRIQASSADEIAALTESFNNMVAGLREKERIKDTFGKYVDPRIVKGLLDNQLSSTGGEKRVMTVFFSDLVGFTALGEQLTPDGVVRFLNRYFTLMSEPIREYGGILDKFIGDAIMAYWGPPFTDEKQHAKLACFSALEQMARLEQFRSMLPDIMGLRKGLPAVNIRMGIATGDVTVGTIGSESAKGFTVIGDTVNMAARLQALALPDGDEGERGRILIGDTTRALLPAHEPCERVGSFVLKGRSEPVSVYRMVGG